MKRTHPIMTTARYTLDREATISGGSVRLLAVALDGDAVTRLGAVRAVEAHRLVRCPSAMSALERARNEQFDVIACRYPLPDLLMREFVNRLRSEGSASEGASLLLLAIPEMMTEAQRAVHRGPACAVPREARVETLHGAVDAMVRASRPANRGTVRVWVGSSEDSHEAQGEVLDLSPSDLLVESTQVLPVASRGRFALRLDHMPVEVRGECEVVRHLQRARGDATGFALRMLQFEDDGRARLAAMLGT